MILLTMIFLHIVDDYCLQGILSKLKQKKWWEANNPDECYKYDYLMALFMHSFSWAFMIMLPIFYINSFDLNLTTILFFIHNLVIHFIIDNLKANKNKINLIQDQSIHLLQIIATYIFCVVI